MGVAKTGMMKVRRGGVGGWEGAGCQCEEASAEGSQDSTPEGAGSIP